MPPLVGGFGELVCLSVGKADLLTDYLDNRQNREFVDQPLVRHPSTGRVRLGRDHVNKGTVRVPKSMPLV